MGSLKRDMRYFRGRISCLQVYSVALKGPEINAVKKICFRASKYHRLNINAIREEKCTDLNRKSLKYLKWKIENETRVISRGFAGFFLMTICKA
jgi:hypothetical protein